MTEEVVKESVASPRADDDFTFILKEDGESYSEWAVYDNDPAGASISTVIDSDRHPDGIHRVIKLTGADGNGFAVGDADAEYYNANDTAWNSTKRVLSFWYKGGMYALYVPVSSSLGARYVTYHSYAGTDYVSGNYVNVYLGDAAGSDGWLRFERDIKADFERVTGATWTNTDGVLIRPDWHNSHDFSIDDIRLSNCRTMKHNSLTGGAIGQIASVREVTGTGGNGSLGLTDTWYHYDHIGNVMNFSNSSGALVAGSIQQQDAWGNLLSDATSGAWATMTDGRNLRTKKYDADANLYYFWPRWFDKNARGFMGESPFPDYMGHPLCLIV